MNINKLIWLKYVYVFAILNGTEFPKIQSEPLNHFVHILYDIYYKIQKDKVVHLTKLCNAIAYDFNPRDRIFPGT